MNSSITVHTAIIISNGVIFLIHAYIPINNIQIVDLIEYLSRRLTKVSKHTIQNENPNVTLVISFDFAIAMKNHIVIGRNVRSIDKK